MPKHHGRARLHQKEVAEKPGFPYNSYEAQLYWWVGVLFLCKVSSACVFLVSTIRYPSRDAEQGMKSTTMPVISISLVVLHISCEHSDSCFYVLLDGEDFCTEGLSQSRLQTEINGHEKF